MKNKFLFAVRFAVILSLTCSFSSSVKAMDEPFEEVNKNPIPHRDTYKQERNKEAEACAKTFLSKSQQKITNADAYLLIEWASLSTLEKLFRVENNNSKILKEHCLESLKTTPSIGYASSSKCFELVHHLCTKNIAIEKEEKEGFLKSLVWSHSSEILFYSEKGETYLPFLRDNKETLLKALSLCYMMPDQEADFWTALVDYIEPNPTKEQLKTAAEINEQVARSNSRWPHIMKVYSDRAEKYRGKLSIKRFF